ncbi:GTP-binding protein [Afifella sp. IM 167]|uniref:CobW family GTP-binding protein n=1 Tax=Afifella sp. IM 167 TaxID=2033586 RepID=UPI001CCA9481|nr:GTP-binding protein [Afifella sp. IM 167]MBZ8134488.1 cobalamin synthesis protein P47K [Afifella sp. IM 167]
MDERLPLTIVTGFLGSGKTTLLQRFLRTPQGERTAILVNEFGEAGLDHRLLLHAEERLELIDGGCMCCARRADIARSIHELVRRAKAGGDGGIQHLVIETTGLADPAPIIATIGRDAWMSANVRIGSVVAVLDAVTGLDIAEKHVEARRQIAIADTVVVSKTDLRKAHSLTDISRSLKAIAPDARLFDAQAPDFDIGATLGEADHFRLGGPEEFDEAHERHVEGWHSFLLKLPEQVDWPTFTLWLSALLHAHGDRILRVKGMLRTSSAQGPVVIHGVQHVMHPPHHLPAGEKLDQPFLVFITNQLRREAIEASLNDFMLRMQPFQERAAA